MEYNEEGQDLCEYFKQKGISPEKARAIMLVVLTAQSSEELIQ